MTYTELTTLIQSFLDNNESTFTTTIPDFIKNAEDRIFNLVQEDFFRKNVTGSLTTGSRFLTCPTDFILSFSLAVIDSSSDYHFLDKKHPSFMQEFTPDLTDTSLRGLPKYYADFDKEYSTSGSSGSTIVVAPLPDADYTVELHYLNKPTSLTNGSDSGTTTLSTDYADALLYGALVEGAIFLKEPPEIVAQFEGRFKEAIARMKNISEGRGTRDEYRYDSVRSSVT